MSLLDTLHRYAKTHCRKKSEEENEQEVNRHIIELYEDISKKEAARNPSIAVVPKFFFQTNEPNSTNQIIRKEAQRRIISQRRAQEVLSKQDLDTVWNVFQQYNEEFDNKINYEVLGKIKKELNQKLKGRGQHLFRASNVLKFQLDSFGKFNMQAYYDYLEKKVAQSKIELDLHQYDQQMDGCLREQDLKKYLSDLQPKIAAHKFDKSVLQYYLEHCARKFFFFLDQKNTGKINVKKLAQSQIMQEYNEVSSGNLAPTAEKTNWFSKTYILHIYGKFMQLDKDKNNKLSKEELHAFNQNSLTRTWIDAIWQSRPTKGGQMEFKEFVNLMLAMTYKKTSASIHYFWKILDIRKQGYICVFEFNYFFRDVVAELGKKRDGSKIQVEDVVEEIFDMIKPVHPHHVTEQDLIDSGMGDVVVRILSDIEGFLTYENREYLAQTPSNT